MAPHGRRLACALSLLAALAPFGHAVAQPKSECVAAHADAQVLRKKGALTDAREKLALCAHKTCPALVQKDCTQWLAEVEADQPTIVVVAKDDKGADTLDVRVSIDGKAISTSLDAGAIAVDPGAHVLLFEHGSAKPIEVKVVLHAGEKGRRIDVDFSPPPTTASPVETNGEHPIPTSSWILWGVGGAALVSFAYFGLSGRARESDLSSSCSPHCSSDDVDALKRKYLFADVSLGVGVVAIAVGTVLAFSARSHAVEGTATLSFDVRAIAGGGAIGLGGRF